jgi:thiol-disulfide isomerase/thioredoxin
MKRCLWFSLFIFSSLSSQSQTFNECAAVFNSKWKKIQLDAATQKRDDKKMDSLRRKLETAFDECIIGNTLPEFNLVSRNGKTVTSEDLYGKVVYLNIWTIHCGACWAEIPVLNKIDTVYNDNKDFVFLSLLLDKEEDLSAFLQKTKMRRGIDFDLVANEAPFGTKDLKRTLPMPTHLFIDRQGRITKKLTGSSFDLQRQEESLRTVIDDLLAK